MGVVHRRWRLAVWLALIAVAFAVTVSPTPAGAFGRFWDDDGNIHEGSIEAIAAAGVTNGCGEGQYCPGLAVTRGQMATFLVRALQLPPGSGDVFTDVAGHPHGADVGAIAAAGITKGCGAGRFCPDEAVSRAQMASFLTRALGLAPSGLQSFTDDDGNLHEADIEALAAAGITKGCGGGRYCPQVHLSRAEMATFLARALGLEPISPVPVGWPGEADRTLVARYHVMDRRDDGDRIHVDDMQYRPRGFHPGLDVDPDPDPNDVDRVDSTGTYGGWDALSPSTAWRFKNWFPDDLWMNFELTRPARVGVVWRGDLPLPRWLTGWEQGGTVGIDGKLYPVYERSFPAGPVALGSVEATTKWRPMYLVLVAEAGGIPSAVPPVPAGHPVPVPNSVCPEWVHARHATTGPDGHTYNTWHPQIDPVYWCSFGHEHGSDPSVIPGAPMVPYGYVSQRAGRQEPDSGFKEFIFPHQGHWVRFVVHGGTAGHGRVCNRHHTLYAMVYDASGNQKVNVGFKADFGAAMATGDSGGGPLDPTVCGVHMPTLAEQVGRRDRRINVGVDSRNYERWASREDTNETRNLGLAQFEFSFDVRNPMSHCVDLRCDTVSLRDPARDNGSRRTIRIASWRSNFLFGSATALGRGTFFTDPLGGLQRAESDPDAVRQYVAPGFSLGILKSPGPDRVECVAGDPWRFDYACYQIGGAGGLEHLPHVPDMNIEHSLRNN